MSNGKGSWRTKSEVNVSSLVQTLGYFSQMQDRSDIMEQNIITSMDNQVNKLITNYAGPSGIHNLTDITKIDTLRSRLEDYKNQKLALGDYAGGEINELFSGSPAQDTLDNYMLDLDYRKTQISNLDNRVEVIDNQGKKGFEFWSNIQSGMIAFHDNPVYDDVTGKPIYTKELKNNISSLEKLFAAQTEDILDVRNNFTDELKLLPHYGAIIGNVESALNQEIEMFTKYNDMSRGGFIENPGLMDAIKQSIASNSPVPIVEFRGEVKAIRGETIQQEISLRDGLIQDYEELHSIITRKLPIVGKDDLTGENIYEISRKDKSSGERLKIHLPESQIDLEFLGPYESIVGDIQKIEDKIALYGSSVPSRLHEGKTINPHNPGVKVVNNQGSGNTVPVKTIKSSTDPVTTTTTSGMKQFDINNTDPLVLQGVYDTVRRFEGGDRASRHNNWGAHIYTEDLADRFGAKQGDAFVDSSGVTRHTALYDDPIVGDEASKYIVDKIWKDANGDVDQFFARYQFGKDATNKDGTGIVDEYNSLLVKYSLENQRDPLNRVVKIKKGQTTKDGKIINLFENVRFGDLPAVKTYSTWNNATNNAKLNASSADLNIFAVDRGQDIMETKKIRKLKSGSLTEYEESDAPVFNVAQKINTLIGDNLRKKVKSGWISNEKYNEFRKLLEDNQTKAQYIIDVQSKKGDMDNRTYYDLEKIAHKFKGEIVENDKAMRKIYNYRVDISNIAKKDGVPIVLKEHGYFDYMYGVEISPMAIGRGGILPKSSWYDSWKVNPSKY